MRKKILLLGGTIGSRQIAEAVATTMDVDATVSLAGATRAREEYALPMKVGGFGGALGLSRYLIENRIDLLVDATHPYAAQISRNALGASERAGIPLITFERPSWEPVEGDRWTIVRDMETLVKRVERLRSRNIFVALGRNELQLFETAPQHNYLIRSIEVFNPPLNLPNAGYIRSRPPYYKADEIDLMRHYRTNLMISKNSGVSLIYGKIAAARELGIPVLMLRRPQSSAPARCKSVAETISAIAEFVRQEAYLVA